MDVALDSTEKYRILFDSIDEGFCIIEMLFDERQKPVDYRFLEVNKSFEMQTGLYNAVGKRMREFAPDHEEHWFEIYGNIALTGKSTRFENRAEQLHRWYDVYAFRFGDPQNMQVAILFNDITQRKRAEELLKIANKELEAFSYSVSHDLKTPLRIMTSLAKILNKDHQTGLNEEGKHLLQTIEHSAEKMSRLIDALLSFSILGKKEMQKAPVDMYKLTEEVVGELYKIAPHTARIIIHPLPVVKGDYELLYHVMYNLISNAIKYSSKVPYPRIEIASEDIGTMVKISIKDNGAGFDARFVHKLFDAFQRLHSQEEFEGSGVGLAIVERIITRHEGKVGAEGKINEGATFYFSIPK
jgi:signal transduction histidine kinase